MKTWLLRYHQHLGLAMLFVWAAMNTWVLTSSILSDAQRAGRVIDGWQVWSWEISSHLVIFLLVVPLVVINDYFRRFAVGLRVLAHMLMTIPFSLIHVGAMVAIRKLWYSHMGSEYVFGDWQFELLYEYRKDVLTYFSILAVAFGYRLFVFRLKGEASYIAEEQSARLPERLLVRKLGKEFLVKLEDVEWIEAAGNYVNLHTQESVFPMRNTMANMEYSLPKAQFGRIHRSTIVNLNFVKEIQALETGDYTVTLRDGHTVNMSRRYRENFKGKLRFND